MISSICAAPNITYCKQVIDDSYKCEDCKWERIEIKETLTRKEFEKKFNSQKRI